MKGKFFIPKIALFALLLGFLAQKFVITDGDLKAGQKDKIEAPDFLESADVRPANTAPVAYSQADPVTIDNPDPETPPTPTAPQEESGGAWEFIRANLVELLFGLLGLLEVIVRLTKTDKDNSVLNFLKTILDAIIPNRRAGGGLH